MNKISNLSKNKYTIKAKSCQTISFLGARPNYFKITNGGNTSIYVGISMTPTEDYFDEKISPASTKLCVDAFGSEQIYILNPSEYDTNIIITSFSGEFDASAVAMSGFGQDFSSIELSGEFDAKGDLKEILSGIKSSSTSNKNTLSTMKTSLSSIVSAMIASSGTSYLNNMNKHVVDLCNYFYHDNQLIDILNDIKNKKSVTDLSEIINKITDLSDNNVDRTLFYDLIDRLCGGNNYPGLINNVINKLDTINQNLSGNHQYADTKLVAFNLYKLGDVDCDLSKIPSLAGYTINRILGCSNPDITNSIGIADTVIMASENNTTREVNILPIDIWNELYAGTGKTTLNAWCDVDPLSSQIIIEAVSEA